MHFASAFWIVVYAGMLLAWPTAVFVWQRRVRKGSKVSAVAFAAIIGLLSVMLGGPMIGAVAVKPHSWLFSNIVWVLPLAVIALPLAVIVVAVVIASRRQDQ